MIKESGVFSLPLAHSLLKMYYLSMLGEPVPVIPNTFIKDTKYSIASYGARRDSMH